MMGMQGAGERQTERLAFGAKMEQDRFGASAHWMAGIGTVALAVAGDDGSAGGDRCGRICR